MKYSFEYIKNFFKINNCELLEKEYKNNKHKMKYKCSCNNISIISFNHFQKGVRCMNCSGSIKYKYEYVKNYFKSKNCILLSENYINTDNNLEYICSCKNISKISFNRFKRGERCRTCGFDKSSKSSIKFKDYICPSGKIIRIQGFENLALDELFLKYKETEILTNKSDMPKIIYTLNDKEHRYYPDIYIPTENIIIEVKSDYTYKRDLLKNLQKALATKKLNFIFQFWIYNKYNKKIVL
jgi:hypothetical protein